MRIQACFFGVSFAALGVIAGLATAGETLVLSGTGHVEEAFDGYPGTDHPAFTGLMHLDPLSFYIEFDSDVTPLSDDGVEAVYDLTGGSAYFVLNAP